MPVVFGLVALVAGLIIVALAGIAAEAMDRRTHRRRQRHQPPKGTHHE